MDEDFGFELLAERKQLLNVLRQCKFTRLDPEVIHQQIIPFASYSPWLKDEEFLRTYETVRNNTLVDIYRCFELWDSVKQLKTTPGCILEVGVWNGGTGAILTKAAEATNAQVFLADTFTGVIKPTPKDTLYKGGEHSDSKRTAVEELFERLHLKNFQILEGIFPEETGKSIEGQNIRLCHIDVDTYESGKDVFEFIWDRIVPGGIVVFDDYGFWGCEGITKFVNDIQDTGMRKFYNLNGHALLVKIEP